MTDDGAITNRMLLEHIQASKLEVLQKIEGIDGRVGSLELRFHRLEQKVERGFAEVDRKFEEARQHRQALKEDLEATIRTQWKHQKQLAVLTGQPALED